MPSEIQTNAPVPPSAPGWKHLVCGAGGSRAILASAGALVSCQVAGLDSWETLGGISGGSVPSLLLAAGYSPAEMLRMAVAIDFGTLVPRQATPLSTIVAFLLKDRFEYTRPKKGVLCSDKMGEFINDKVPVWPKNYWTMAVAGQSQILFTANGVYRYLSNGQSQLISDAPPSVGDAIRATCAIPGIIDSVPYMGRHLFDGGLSWDGQCPVGVVMRHYGSGAHEIVGCDVGSDTASKLAPIGGKLWSLICGNHCVGSNEPKALIPSQVTMMKPDVRNVRSLQFSPTLEQKWDTIMAGFRAGVQEFETAGVLTGERLAKAQEIAADLRKLQELAA